MFFDYFPRRFLKEVVFCNLETILLIIVYNLLAFLVPLAQISGWAAVLILLAVNAVLFGLKFIHAQLNYR